MKKLDEMEKTMKKLSEFYPVFTKDILDLVRVARAAELFEPAGCYCESCGADYNNECPPCTLRNALRALEGGE